MELVAENFKQTEVGLIPSDWEVKELGEICFPSKTRINPITSSKSYKCIELEHLAQGSGILLGYVNSDELKSQKSVFEEGDVLFGKLRPYLRKYYLADFDGVCTTEIWVLKSENETFNGFLYQLIQGNRIIEAANLSTGTKMPRAEWKTVSETKIPVPTKPEQTAIATALSDADALISSLEKLIIKKRNIKQGAMQKLLQPKEGWEVKRLPEIVWFQEGPGVRNSQFTSSGVKLLNGTNIEDGKLILDKTDRYISENEAYGWYSHFLVDDGDILIACSGVTIDKFDEKVTIANTTHLPLCMNTSTMRFKIISSSLSKNYFLHFLKSKSFKQQIGGKATGSAQLNFGPSHVKMVDISLPNLQDQENIATILSDMDAEISALEIKLEKYRKVKLGMMQNLLTGKIRLV